MNNTSYPWYLTWPVIIIAFLFFWPLAIVLIYLRTQKSKGGAFAAASNKKIYMVLGAILIFLGLGSFGDSTMMALFLIAGGVAMIYYANTLAKKASRNKIYIDMIVNQGETSIDKIASMLNVKSDIVVKELETMQTLGILKGASINYQTRSITVQRAQNTVNQVSGMVNSITNSVLDAASNNATSMVQTACPGCGAKYTGQQGTTCTCDYCDASFIFK